ncbi:hypothetical protein [Massilia sp. DWR3-1-1]|uniref:hypothetical protein n=1 Tax=Massilia sp. DWR3-1-1 TaxID=2804559 RepID=UPI003CFAED06
MPFLGLGLHVIVALFFAIHAVRTGRELYWLLILFMFPLLGSVVYFAVVFLPDARLQRGLARATGAIDRAVQPGRPVREARAAFALAPTAANRVSLATALLDTGEADAIAEAVDHYDACLAGPFAGDAELQLGAARARLANAQPGEAIGILVTVRAAQPGFRPEQLGLTLAAAYDSAGRHAEAGVEYEALVERFASIEARAGLAMWALAHGRPDLAGRELKELDLVRQHLNKHARGQYRALFQKLDGARAQA